MPRFGGGFRGGGVKAAIPKQQQKPLTLSQNREGFRSSKGTTSPRLRRVGANKNLRKRGIAHGGDIHSEIETPDDIFAETPISNGFQDTDEGGVEGLFDALGDIASAGPAVSSF